MYIYIHQHKNYRLYTSNSRRKIKEANNRMKVIKKLINI